MTDEAKTMLKVVAYIIGAIALLFLSAWVALASEFPDDRGLLQDGIHCRSSLPPSLESGDCCTFRLAVGMHNPAAEFHNSVNP